MRNFIVSDLHGDGTIYDSIMAYLENINNDSNEDITLYINGDLIDRGYDIGRMLLDVKDRITNNRGFKIEYLAGNHELMMYQTSIKMKDGKWPSFSHWFISGGSRTVANLEHLSLDEYKEIVNFISNLKLYHKFEETLDGKRIVLAHSKCPSKVKDICDLTIKDNNKEVYDIVWSRKNDYIIIPPKIGNNDYFTIIGHTPLEDHPGFKYYKNENYLNIDGGCAGYVLGYPEYNHVPLVEIDSKNNRLIILIFNNNNEIIDGYYFSNGKTTKIEDLSDYKKYISNNVKIKKMRKYDNSVIFE